MKKILLIFLFFVSLVGWAQNGIDNLWLLGTHSIPHISTTIDFNSSVPQVDSSWRPMSLYYNNASISDSFGNLLFYTNGCYIANRNDTLLANGDHLNPGQCTDDFCGASGNIVLQGSMIIPNPGNSSQYYLFHETCDYNSPIASQPSKLYYSIVDMSLDGGLGAVTLKNQIIINDVLDWGFLTACKHANGRDWWIITHKQSNNEIYKLLLTPNGLQGPFTQAIGPTGINNFGGQTAFSPDGTFLVTGTFGRVPTGWATVYLYEFDRCSGFFSNVQNIDVGDSASGYVSVSPNSRFLYNIFSQGIQQLDLNAPDIQASKVIVDTVDGTFCGPITSLFGYLQLAANGKIYSSSSCPELHCINYPDSLGLACDAQMHAITLYGPSETIPNYPNYRLGPVAGSICDSLTILDNISTNKLNLEVFPNPSSTGIFHLQFNDLREQIKSIEVTDVTGRIIYMENKSASEINLSNLTAGIYFYFLLTKREKIFNGILIKS